MLRKLFDRLVAQPSDMGNVYSGRTVSVAIHDWALWWALWVDDDGWTRSRPRWRQGSFYPLDAIFGKMKNSERLLERREIAIHMPEGLYKGVCEMKEGTWQRARWPFPKRIVRAHIDMTDPIPIPGKGENSWDCGEDATHGSTFLAQSIPEAVGYLTGSILRTRERHGGRDWRPEERKKSDRVEGVDFVTLAFDEFAHVGSLSSCRGFNRNFHVPVPFNSAIRAFKSSTSSRSPAMMSDVIS